MMVTFTDVYKRRPIPEDAIAFLYRLIEQRMTEPEVNISATMPTMQEHRQFIYRRPYRLWYLIGYTAIDGNHHHQTVGYISATDRNEIGIVLLKEHRGKGIGREALRGFLMANKPLPAVPSVRRGRWVANINPANVASIALFTGLGARHIQNTYEL